MSTTIFVLLAGPRIIALHGQSASISGVRSQIRIGYWEDHASPEAWQEVRHVESGLGFMRCRGEFGRARAARIARPGISAGGRVGGMEGAAHVMGTSGSAGHLDDGCG